MSNGGVWKRERKASMRRASIHGSTFFLRRRAPATERGRSPHSRHFKLLRTQSLYHQRQHIPLLPSAHPGHRPFDCYVTQTSL